MQSFEPNVIVIDDKPDEVTGILKTYREQGIGCKFYHVGRNGDAELPTRKFSDVNLIYLDLYFSEDINSFDPEICVNWIQAMIHTESFYILIIWTREVEHKDIILKLLKEFKVTPFLCFVYNKSDFISKDQAVEKYDFTRLLGEINNQLDQTPAISEIGLWKKSIKGAANRVVGGLTKDQDSNKLITKLKKVIFGHGGISMITSLDAGRKRSVLFDALDLVLASNTSALREITEISKLNRETLYVINREDLNGLIDNELNSWFHFKLEPDIPDQGIIPGVLSKYNSNFLKKKFSIIDDSRLNPKLKPQKNENGTTLFDIVMVISRPCDIAQIKYGKNIKLLSGILIQNPQRKDGRIVFDGCLPDSVKLLDYLYFSESENDVAVLFDYRYVYSIPEDVYIGKFQHIKIFNKELVSEILVDYSSYSNRLGITQII